MAEPVSTLAVIKTGVPIALEIYEILKKKGVYEKVVDYIMGNESIDVLILGSTGSGKSAFLKSLQGLPGFIPREQRTAKVEKTEGKIQEVAFRFLDTPGQELHKSMRMAAIKEAAVAKRLGVINVVSYGFHEAAGDADKALIDGHPSGSYLEDCRQKEVERLGEWTDLLGGVGGSADWMLTVVTKADLWWTINGHPTVLRHYETGDYAAALGEANQLKRAVRPYSSLNGLFYGVGPMTGFYTDEQRKEDHRSLITMLLLLAADV